MIPRTPRDVDLLVEEARGQSAEVSEILTGASPEAARWRPDETRWSLAGHVAHLTILNRAYLDVIESRSAVAEDAGVPDADGALPLTYRHPWVATRFVGMMGRVRFGSPFLPLLRFSLGTGFALILAHNRRHLWLMNELMQHPDHPVRLQGQ